MPLVAVAACPHPPVLLPQIAGGAAGELDGLRSACAAAIDRLRAATPDCLIIVGTGAQTARLALPARGSFAPYGTPIEVALDAAGAVPGAIGVADGPAARLLPLSLTVGAWLLARQPINLPLIALSVLESESPANCAALGREHATGYGARAAMLVLGDGSACRSERAPGYADPRAEPFDAGVTRAFAEADVAALRALDPALCAALVVGGRAPWQVLAGAAGDTGWRGEVHYDAAPYGVEYRVASWASTCG